jgi:hypothetical protein
MKVIKMEKIKEILNAVVEFTPIVCMLSFTIMGIVTFYKFGELCDYAKNITTDSEITIRNCKEITNRINNNGISVWGQQILAPTAS